MCCVTLFMCDLCLCNYQIKGQEVTPGFTSSAFFFDRTDTPGSQQHEDMPSTPPKSAPPYNPDEHPARTPNGTFKNAEDMTWVHSPSDEAPRLPAPPVSSPRQKRPARNVDQSRFRKALKDVQRTSDSPSPPKDPLFSRLSQQERAVLISPSKSNRAAQKTRKTSKKTKPEQSSKAPKASNSSRFLAPLHKDPGPREPSEPAETVIEKKKRQSGEDQTEAAKGNQGSAEDRPAAVREDQPEDSQEVPTRRSVREARADVLGFCREVYEDGKNTAFECSICV